MLSLVKNLSLFVFGVFVAGCANGYVDRTNDPRVRFDDVAYRCFVTQESLFIINDGPNRITNGLSLEPPAHGDRVSGMPDSVEAYLARPKEYWAKSVDTSHIADVIPKGTHLTLTNLIQETLESGGYMPFATLADGPYKGKLVAVPQLLYDPTLSDSGGKWAVLPRYLVPCDQVARPSDEQGRQTGERDSR